jgi:D-3-phosphoglycerate dehydrogenase
MPNQSSIAVCSKTFSNTSILVEELKKCFSNLEFNYEKDLDGDELVAFIGEAKGAIVALEKIDNYILDRCPNLEVIVKYGVGLDNLDLASCKRHNVRVGWTGGTNRLSVAEMTIGFMLALSRNLFRSSLELKWGLWNKNGGLQLSGRTVGIIGVGNVGKEVIRLLKPFNCRIMVNDIINQDDYYQAQGVKEASKEQILKEAEIISLHMPLNSDTKHFINETTLALIRPDAYIINTARGPLVDYSTLKDSLLNKKVAGFATDVYDEEPPKDKELLSFDNVICTPHIGGNSKEAVFAMGMSAIDHLKQYFIV